MNLQRFKTIILFLMTTFYMSGCSNDNVNAIDYFEARYFAVEKIVEADNRFQESITNVMTEKPEEELLTDEEFDDYYFEIINAFDSLKTIIKQLESNKLPKSKTETDYNLNRSFEAVIAAYDETIKNQYERMVGILVENDENKDLSSEFKALYDSASLTLNERLTTFYATAEHFGKANDLEINWEKE